MKMQHKVHCQQHTFYIVLDSSSWISNLAMQVLLYEWS